MKGAGRGGLREGNLLEALHGKSAARHGIVPSIEGDLEGGLGRAEQLRLKM